MLIIYSKYLVPKGFAGITIYPFVFLRTKKKQEDLVLLNHERIHLRQQIEMLIVFFFIWYFVEFLIHWAKEKDKKKAYRKLSFEREAYENEFNKNYLNNRRWLEFRKYLK